MSEARELLALNTTVNRLPELSSTFNGLQASNNTRLTELKFNANNTVTFRNGTDLPSDLNREELELLLLLFKEDSTKKLKPN